MQLFFARQPIFDARQRVFAYEILFRSGLANAFDGSEQNTATAKVINAVFGSSDTERFMAGRPAFLNFPRQLLVNETPSILPPAQTVVEVLETVEPDDEVIAACRRLRALGYRLALDDFPPANSGHPLIALADFLKIDFRAASPAEQKFAAKQYRGRLHLLAEKVETPEEFRRAARMGYEYFQGYFFARPELSSTRQIPGVKLNYLRILQEIQRAEFDFERLSDLLKREHALSYKLLRLVNSAWFGRRTPIESIHQALLFIGEQSARKWLAIAALADLAADQPNELALSTLVRARFAELLAPEASLAARAGDCFLMGMFSRLDAMLGRPLAELLDGLNLNEEVKRVLAGAAGTDDRLGVLWETALAYEAGDWTRLAALATALGVDPAVLAPAYTAAVNWADAIHES